MWTRLLVWFSRLHALVFGRRLDEDFDHELQSHVALLTDEHVRRGLAPDEAARQARLRLGGVTQLEERRRDERSFPRIETALKDAQYALRLFAKNPGFTLVAVLTLAVGIGAGAAMFSVVHAVLLRPLPYAEPDRLVRIFETNPLKRWARSVVAPANFADWQKQNTVFTEMAAYNGTNDHGESRFDVFLTGHGDPEPLKALAVSGNLFRVLGVAPLLGRSFTDDETFEDKGKVAILSYGLWQRLFAGDPAVVGRTISLSGATYDVVGVMPRGFFFPGRDVQLWLPFGYKPSILVEMRRAHWLTVLARLRPGVSIAQARSDMETIASRLERTYPDTNTKMGVRLEGFHESLSVESKTPLLMLLGAVGFLFLIVCVNLANLQLGRGAGRIREMAIRQALGASRRRLVQQLFTEGVVLSALGGAAGLGLAAAARSALLTAAPDAVPVFADVRIDGSVLLFAVGLSLTAPIVFGLAPALSSSRSDALNDRSDIASRGTRSARSLLVACEVALSVVLVVGAGLLLRSLIRLQNVDPGFDPDRVVTFKVRFPRARYPDDAKTLRAIEDLEARLRAMPGVDAVGGTTTLALRGFAWTGDATVEGRAATDYERELRHDSVTPGYFRAMGTRLVSGRFLDERDREKSPPVTLVNETLAKKYFQAADPVGKRIKFGRPQDKDPWIPIVGVVADEQQDGMDVPVQPEAYVPIAQDTQNDMTFVIRTPLAIDAIIAAARTQARAVDKDLAMTDVSTLGDVVAGSVGDQRFRTMLLSGFAGVALFLAALGIYGVLAYVVVQRAREIAIRLALGAAPARLLRMVVGQGLRPVLWGSIAGLAAAYVVTGLMKTLLFGIEPLDPPTYALAAVILVAVALGACALPALRATRVDPLVALREE